MALDELLEGEKRSGSSTVPWETFCVQESGVGGRVMKEIDGMVGELGTEPRNLWKQEESFMVSNFRYFTDMNTRNDDGKRAMIFNNLDVFSDL